MKSMLVLALVLISACSATSAVSTSTTPVATTISTTTTTVPSVDCGSVPYEVASLPAGVDGDRPVAEDIVQDQFTTIPGTVLRLWPDADGDLAMVLVRGALPPVEWPGDRGEVNVDGARGVAGPLEDGGWMVAWFEGRGEPCDQYFMVFYPPVDPADVQATILSLNRTAG
jgi:hypothetical protein